MSSSERKILITGGTSGIGEGIALAFADAGDEVVVTGRSAEEVEACIQRWRQSGRNRLRGMILDVADVDAITRLVDSFPTLDVLVNCAGMIRRAGAEFDPATFAEVVDVNLNGTLRMSVACHPLLKSASGCVINIASMLSFFGSGVAPAYSASKGGVAQLTKSLAIAWAAEGIRVNALAPGWIATPLTQPLVEDPARSQAIMARTPLGRWGDPADVAGAALFLASTAARYITGIILPVDGGYSIA